MRASLSLLLVGAALAGCLADTTDQPVIDPPLPVLAFSQTCLPPSPQWPDPCTTLASPNDSPSKAEIDLAINPTDPNNIVVASKDLDRSASECVWSVAQVTKDGGQTWTTVYVGGDLDNREPLLQPFACITDPIMMFDNDGVLYYALQAYRFVAGPTELPAGGIQPILGSTFVLARSRDGGLTWDKYVLQHVGDGVGVFHDYPRMLLNPASGSVHTIWNGVGEAGVSPWVSTTRDGGETVDGPVTFWAEGSERETAFASGFAATRDGTVYATTWVAYAQTRTFHLFKSTDDARSFDYVGPGVEVNYIPRQLETNEFRTPGFVELAADTSGGERDGWLYAVWTDYGEGNSDVLTAWSDDGGASWSEPVRVNDDDTAADQLFPRAVVGPGGVLHIHFLDRRHDPDNRLLDAYYAYSTDGGATFTNVRLTASGFDGDLGIHQNGFPFIGDYNGIGVFGDDVWIAWSDTRTGRAEVAVAHVRASAAPGATDS